MIQSDVSLEIRINVYGGDINLVFEFHRSCAQIVHEHPKRSVSVAFVDCITDARRKLYALLPFAVFPFGRFLVLQKIAFDVCARWKLISNISTQPFQLFTKMAVHKVETCNQTRCRYADNVYADGLRNTTDASAC